VKVTWGAVYWPVALCAVVMAFAPAELAALFTNPGNTLSWFAWTELGIGGRYDPHTAAWWISLAGWALFVFVITGHIWFRTPN
jgi:hypothetical protein